MGRLSVKGGLRDFEFPPHNEKKECNIKSIIDESERIYMHLKRQTQIHLNAWQHFLDKLTERKIDINLFIFYHIHPITQDLKYKLYITFLTYIFL